MNGVLPQRAKVKGAERTAMEVHAGRSTCDVMLRGDGRLRIVEHFQWSTREGSGTNVFDELVG
jgi:hypothetical protein